MPVSLVLQKNHDNKNIYAQEKHESMSKFLQGIKDQNKDQEDKLAQILRGGKGQQKRLHSVDKNIYGTEEGAKLQKEASSAAQKTAGEKSKKKKNKKKDGSSEGKEDNDLQQLGEMQQSSSIDRVKQSVAVMAVVGTVAAGASFFLGGKRSQ